MEQAIASVRFLFYRVPVYFASTNMSLMKFHAILDDGRRCRYCCNRLNNFGSVGTQVGVGKVAIAIVVGIYTS